MGMKEITLPEELLNLPQPYGEADFMRRHKQLELLTYQPNEIKTALNVLERCLHSLCLFAPLQESGHLIPDSLMEYWGFTVQWLAEEMPTLDYFRLSKVEGKLREYGIDSPSAALTLDLAQYWLWSVLFNIADSALRWVEGALRKTYLPPLISRFLYITECYWDRVEPELADSLLSASAVIARQKVLPLFESVEQNPKASQDVLETVRDYRDLVLDNPHKWLPDWEEAEALPTDESPRKRGADPQRMSQPAVGELVYAA